MLESWSPGGQCGERILCFGSLSTGHFQYVKDDGEAEEGSIAFKMSTRDARDEDSCSEERLLMPCAPLSSGVYNFSCSSVSDSAKMYDGGADIELKPGGSLSREMRESLGWHQYKAAKVTGTWTPELVRFTMTRGHRSAYYASHSTVIDCTFICTPTVAGLRGTWQTEALKPDDAKFEAGAFSFSLDHCKRRAWNEAVHSYFPPAFSQSVRWLLLSSLRVPAESTRAVVPSSLWSHVLQYTDQDWFKADMTTQKRAIEISSKGNVDKKRRVDLCSFGQID